MGGYDGWMEDTSFNEDQDTGRLNGAGLRRGWTTGACATAAAKGAYEALLSGTFPNPVTIRLPRGQRAEFRLIKPELGTHSATATVIKDAGDDPDVTHSSRIRVQLRAEGNRIRFCAGIGVGTITKPGFSLPIGEPAINPIPRQMMLQAIFYLN